MNNMVTGKLIKDFHSIMNSVMLDKFYKVSIDIQNIIMAKYDDELVDVVTDRDSKTNPNFYRDEFSNRLSKFNFIEKTNSNISIIVPDIDNFDFSGRLRVIEFIIQGAAGVYVEINEDDYIKIFNKKPINEDPLDDYVPPKEKIYLVKYNSRIKASEKELKKKFVRYPFSNTPPIDILSVGDVYVEKNIDNWIKEAIEDAQKIFVSKL